MTHRNQEWYDAESTQKLQGKYFLKWFDFLFLKKKQSLQENQTVRKVIFG